MNPVFTLILGSKLESAKKFKHWVTSEVLPSIRKNGSLIDTCPASRVIYKKKEGDSMGLFDKDSFNKALKRATFMAMMDEDEREALLFDKGLDPSDFDFD